MRSDFEPRAIQEAKQVVEKYLDRAHHYQIQNKSHQANLKKMTLWKRLGAWIRGMGFFD